MSTTPLTDEAWRQWQDGETEGDGTHREAAYHMKDFASTLESQLSTLTRKLAEDEAQRISREGFTNQIIEDLNFKLAEAEGREQAAKAEAFNLRDVCNAVLHTGEGEALSPNSRELLIQALASSPPASPEPVKGLQWQSPASPPTVTGQYLVRLHDREFAIVKLDEIAGVFNFFYNNESGDLADPDEWEAWARLDGLKGLVAFTEAQVKGLVEALGKIEAFEGQPVAIQDNGLFAVDECILLARKALAEFRAREGKV